MAGEIVQFNIGDVTRTHTIFINDDDECEKDPNEHLFSRIALENSIPGITVTVPQAEVTINDTAEPECGKIAKKSEEVIVSVFYTRTNHCWLYS